MSNKSYNQYCSIAHALDAVGDRWALLIARNLLLGPKRFSDLMKGLPGISTNMLSERLKSLEKDGVVNIDYLPPPAASTVYQLTPYGTRLADVLIALAKWGGETLDAPTPDQTIPAESVEFMVQGMFWRTIYPANALLCTIQVKYTRYNHTHNVQLSPQGVALLNSSTSTPDVTLGISLEDLSALSTKRVRLQSLIDTNAVQISGDASAIHKLLAWVDNVSTKQR